MNVVSYMCTTTLRNMYSALCNKTCLNPSLLFATSSVCDANFTNYALDAKQCRCTMKNKNELTPTIVRVAQKLALSDCRTSTDSEFASTSIATSTEIGIVAFAFQSLCGILPSNTADIKLRKLSR